MGPLAHYQTGEVELLGGTMSPTVGPDLAAYAILRRGIFYERHASGWLLSALRGGTPAG